jgi:hypothetical protein
VKKVKKTNDYSVFQKRSGRYAVRDNDKKWLHGEDKTKVLLGEGLIKLPEPKPAAPAEPEAAPAEESTEAAPAS